MPKDNAPHLAIFRITYEIHEQLPTGECSGSPKQVGKERIIVKGFSLDDAEKKKNELIEGLKNEYR